MSPQHDSDATRSVVAPGNYDGVHRGHRALLEAAGEVARPLGVPVTVLTFDPHPARVLTPARAPALLTTIERRTELLRALGADDVTVLRFDRALAGEGAVSFVERVLVAQLGARGVVVGPDFRFGRGASGDVALLEELGREHGFTVRALGPVELDGAPVSSTRVRVALRGGDIAQASACLGRVHDVTGTVVLGDQRGRTIGVPTANLDAEPVLMPADGVYAVVARVIGSPTRLEGVANLGVRPTFAAGRSVEVHLFDFDRDIYGARLRVGFVGRLRGEQRFDGLEALKAQIGRDMEDAKKCLAGADRAEQSWI